MQRVHGSKARCVHGETFQENQVPFLYRDIIINTGMKTNQIAKTVSSVFKHFYNSIEDS